MVRVFLVRLEDALPLRDRLVEALPSKRKERALRFLRVEDQARSALGTLLILKFAGKGELLLGENGKPYLKDGRHFNLSHAGQFVGIAISENEVGLDIEDVNRCDMKIVPAAFTPEEAKEICDQESCAFAWTRKEAVAKCTGEGLYRPRSSGLAPLGEGRYEYEGESFFIQSRLFENHVVTVASQKETPFFEIEIISAEELLE